MSEAAVAASAATSPGTALDRMVREILSRARPDVPAGTPTPADAARDEYHALRADNVALADELRITAVERDVAQGRVAQLESDLASARADAASVTRGYVTLVAELGMARGLLSDVMERATRAMDPNPAEVQAFAPSGQTEGTSADCLPLPDFLQKEFPERT